MTDRKKELLDFANDLSNEDLCFLINCMANRCEVYFGSLAKCVLSSEVMDACINGTIVQINCKNAELDDLREDDFFKYAIEKMNDNAECNTLS